MGLKFSVITVAYNTEKTIHKTIESVINQGYQPYEYIIIDGKSEDKTVMIAEEFSDAFARKGINYTIISETDSGIYNAMNKGLKLATGDFISFLNAGDWYEPDALCNVNELYESEPFDLTYGGLNYINPNGTTTKKMSKLDYFPITSRHWNHPSMFLKREIYQKYGFDESFKSYADFDLYLKLRRNGTKIKVNDRIVTNFVADGNSTDPKFSSVLKRSNEKYRAYRNSGFRKIYWVESYGWEIFKSIYFKIRSK